MLNSARIWSRGRHCSERSEEQEMAGGRGREEGKWEEKEGRYIINERGMEGEREKGRERKREPCRTQEHGMGPYKRNHGISALLDSGNFAMKGVWCMRWDDVQHEPGSNALFHEHMRLNRLGHSGSSWTML